VPRLTSGELYSGLTHLSMCRFRVRRLGTGRQGLKVWSQGPSRGNRRSCAAFGESPRFGGVVPGGGLRAAVVVATDVVFFAVTAWLTCGFIVSRVKSTIGTP